MDGGRHVGLFGAIGRETKGAFRSLSYDLRRSRRFRKIGVIAVVTVAGGVIATGALLREPVPGLAGLGGDGEDAGIVDGWFGFGADTTGQDAEASESASAEPSGGEAADPSAGVSPTAEQTQARGSGSGNPPDGSPGLVPIGGEEPSGPGEAESDTETPTQEPSGEPTGGPTGEPTSGPTAQEPTGEPTPAPTTAAPSPTPSGSASEPGEGQATKSLSNAPDPWKAPIGG